MGSRIFRDAAVAPNSSPATSNPSVRRIGGSIDIPLLLIMVVTLSFGLIMVFSASYDYSLGVFNDAMHIFNRQILWMILGSLIALFLSRLDYHIWRNLGLPVMVITIILLIVVLALNDMHLGAVRSMLGGSIQPSELAKVVTIVYLAIWMHSKREQLHDIQWGLIPLALILGIVGGLIYVQPDISATATIFMLGGLLFFLGGGDMKQILILMVIAVFVGIVVVQISATGQARVGMYISGIKDPTQASYHVRRSFEAIVKGGWFGVGIGQSDTKLLGLPVPPTDSIFAVIAEELGLVGAAGTVLLYVLLLWRGLRIADKAPDMLGSLLASGLTVWIAMEAIINMLVMVGLLPFAGNALPFISAGGSSMVASLIAIGILLSVSRQVEPQAETQEWRNFGATIDLRGRNRRRSLSRTSRS
ncbi:MAG: putative peptidoglycan glycosyltransferase FtsW [Chloroflexi bacterium]|nr:putative peptidoglycan glycosyltransferase FtsW [Chloroflexota bacterium]